MKTTYLDNGTLFECSIDRTELNQCSSVHGLARTMERTGKSDRQALRFIRNAKSRGKALDDIPVKWQKRFRYRYSSILAGGETYLCTYCGYLFVFCAEGTLITMYPLPKSYNKKRVYDGKTKVRNVVKYNRMYEGLFASGAEHDAGAYEDTHIYALAAYG